MSSGTGLNPTLTGLRSMGPGLRRDDVEDSRTSSSQHDHVFVRPIGVKPLHPAGAALQSRTLIDVALVGEFVAVDRGWLGHQHRARNAQAACALARRIVRLESLPQTGEQYGE